jgi:hypothetical protein
VPAYVRETPDVADLTSADGVPNAADDCGEAIAEMDASILVATHFLLFAGKEPSGAGIHDTVKGSASTTTKCGELGEEVAVAAATCDKEDDCMGFTASNGVPDCLLVAGMVVEGSKSSSKDTYLKQMGPAGIKFMFDPPAYEEDSCSEECGGGVLNRVMGCKTTANTTVRGGMCSHIAWMNVDSLPDEQIPCNTFPCGPPPKLMPVGVALNGVCIDKDGVPITEDRAYNCGSGLDKYQVAVTQASFPSATSPADTTFMIESADGPCMGTYEGVVCNFVPGCYYNFYTGPNTGKGYNGYTYNIKFGIHTSDGYGRFYTNYRRPEICFYFRGPGESKVGLSDQNVGPFPTFGPKEGWIMSDGARYQSATAWYYYYYYHRDFLQTENEEKDESHPKYDIPFVDFATNDTKAHNESDAVARLFTNLTATTEKWERNGRDLIAVMKNMRTRDEALFESNKAKVEAYKKRKAEEGKKSKACASGKGNQKGKILHLKSK